MWIANWISLRMQGLSPRRVVPNERRTIDWNSFDAILIGGGDDIDVELYDGIPTPNVRIDPARDRLELDAIEKFLKNGRPIFGVCRGSQMINVALGGTLHEDMYEAHQTAPRMRTVLARKQVHLTQGCLLRAVFGQEIITVNSLHNQAVDCLGQDLIVAARDTHSIVQGVERKHLNDQFLVGVQWHPEFLFYRSSHRRLFRAFASAARGEEILPCEAENLENDQLEA
ncbi:MAG: gamma-glutamyl-gamma-aminobutyrate hydrolase family protein [Alphaproteobacteria bacterium]|nr:gamma-glutamyl-gamma-aminobutyrate hydrolase family protein [Alphaproteobacteria bacterium]